MKRVHEAENPGEDHPKSEKRRGKRKDRRRNHPVQQIRRDEEGRGCKEQARNCIYTEADSNDNVYAILMGCPQRRAGLETEGGTGGVGQETLK